MGEPSMGRKDERRGWFVTLVIVTKGMGIYSLIMGHSSFVCLYAVQKKFFMVDCLQVL